MAEKRFDVKHKVVSKEVEETFYRDFVEKLVKHYYEEQEQKI